MERTPQALSDEEKPPAGSGRHREGTRQLQPSPRSPEDTASTLCPCPRLCLQGTLVFTLYILCWRWAATLRYLLRFPDFLNRFFK